MDQTRMPLVAALKDYAARSSISMHIPGHKDGHDAEPSFKAFIGDNAFKIDATEAHGLDDLHQASGAISEAQQLSAEAWGADETFFLINGTTSGIIAALTAAASEGEQVIIPRNAHKSVYMALIISGAEPIYIQPEIDEVRGILGGLSLSAVEETFRNNPGAKAIYVINPTYYGICSDLEGIIAIAHRYGALVIADEAHGSHLYFHERLPRGAMACGADAAVQSTHKMAGSFTQSSMLHIKAGSFDPLKLKTNLGMMQSTSPSYLLMASLDAARCQMATKGHDLFAKLIDAALKTQLKLAEIEGIDCLSPTMAGSHGIADFDPLRFVISASRLGISGYDLHERLYASYGIEGEFADQRYCICILGPGSSEQDSQKLLAAMLDIANKNQTSCIFTNDPFKVPAIPQALLKPRTAYFSKRETIPWPEATGRISAEMIIPYPPGIPTICPGEVITPEIWDFLEQQRVAGRHLHGPVGGKLDFIDVIA